jgi:hypothetical protein
MKNVILFCFAFLCINITCQASHIWGADLTYTCQGNGNYLITYDFYRDCFGVPSPSSMILHVSNSCGINDTDYTMPGTFLSEVFTHCPGLTNTCNGGTMPGYQKWRYQITVHLPDTCPAWIFGVTQCCRDAALMSVTNGSSYQHYTEAIINNTVDCDTSATFNNDLVIEVCKNQPVCIDPGIFDTEGDSIVAYLVNPRVGPNMPLQYDSGYSFMRPITLNAPLAMDPATVTFCLTPLETEWSVYAFVVDMYRDGRFVGQINRDVNIVVVNCAPEQPTISNINGGLSTDTFACENSTLCFDLFTTPFSTPDSTWIRWDSIIPGAQYTILPGQNESAQFCWTPTHQNVSTLPYCFNAYVKDNSCLAAQGSYKTYCITVLDSAGCLLAGMNNLSKEQLEVYPQPATDFIRIKYDGNEKLLVSIRDLFGKIIYEQRCSPVNNEITIPTKEFISGNYFVNVTAADGKLLTNKKIVLIKP